MDAAVVLHFDQQLAAWPPERFVVEVLNKRLGSQRLLMGFDSAFGQGAKGDADYLRSQPGLELEIREAPAFAVDGQTVSSTAVRFSMNEVTWDW